MVELYEVALGIKLRFGYSREQILRMYADVAYFGHGYYGVDRGQLRLLRAAARPALLAAVGGPGRAGPGAVRL